MNTSDFSLASPAILREGILAQPLRSVPSGTEVEVLLDHGPHRAGDIVIWGPEIFSVPIRGGNLSATP